MSISSALKSFRAFREEARSFFSTDEPTLWELAMGVAMKDPELYRRSIGSSALKALQTCPSHPMPGKLLYACLKPDDSLDEVIAVLGALLTLNLRMGVQDGKDLPSAVFAAHYLLTPLRLELSSEADPSECTSLDRGFLGMFDHAALFEDLEGNKADLPQEPAEPMPVIDARKVRQELTAAVKGQDSAIDSVIDQLLLGFSGLGLRPKKPRAVFLFVGPSGVGKTQMAKAIAKSVYGDADAMIRLDMSEYSHEGTITRLTGSSPGYKGSTEPEGWLTTKVMENPRCVLLLDEIEKADPQVMHTFLQVFDEGRLTDGLGRTASFTDIVVCMTSNLGSRDAFAPAVGFGERGPAAVAQLAQTRIDQAVRQFLPPEVIGRIDDVIQFSPLDEAAIAEIAEEALRSVIEGLAAQDWQVDVDSGVVESLTEEVVHSPYGVRALQHLLERRLVVPILKWPHGHFEVCADGDGINVRPVRKLELKLGA